MANREGKYRRDDVVFYRVIFGMMVSFIIAIIYGYITGDIYLEYQPVTVAVLLVMLLIVVVYALLELFAWYVREYGVFQLKRRLRISYYLLIGNTDKANVVYRLDE